MNVIVYEPGISCFVNVYEPGTSCFIYFMNIGPIAL